MAWGKFVCLIALKCLPIGVSSNWRVFQLAGPPTALIPAYYAGYVLLYLIVCNFAVETQEANQLFLDSNVIRAKVALRMQIGETKSVEIFPGFTTRISKKSPSFEYPTS